MIPRRIIALLVLGSALVLDLSFPPLARAGDEQTRTQRTPGGVTHTRARHMVATIQSIEEETRTVTLRGEDGSTKTITVPKSVKAFGQLAPGQRVDVGYYESLAVAVKKPGEAMTGNEASQSSTSLPAENGRGPGRMEVKKMTVNALITAVDVKNNRVTLQNSSGESRTVDVEDPELRGKLATVKPGERVEITYTEAIAASLVPMSKKP
jgi:hypothetical protein